jgi:hypothetical protein
VVLVPVADQPGAAAECFRRSRKRTSTCATATWRRAIGS